MDKEKNKNILLKNLFAVFLAGAGLAMAAASIAVAIAVNASSGGNAELSSYETLATVTSAAEATASESDETDVMQDVPLKDVDVRVSVNENSVTVPDIIKKLVCDYLKEKYISLGQLSYKSLEYYFDRSDSRGELYSQLSNTSNEYLIFVRNSRWADLSFEKAEVGVTFTECEREANIYTFNFLINDAIDFAFTGKTSYSSGMEVDAVAAVYPNGSVLFRQYAEDTDTNLLIENEVLQRTGFNSDDVYLKDVELPANTNLKSMFTSIRAKIMQNAAINISEQKTMLDKFNAAPSEFTATKKAKVLYNAERAVKYSYRWVDALIAKRNPKFSDYSPYGGNCQNYCSQCLFYGGIPMDYSGRKAEEQWKFYSDIVNNREVASGRTTSWSGTEYFYDYCVANTGTGLVAEPVSNIFAGGVGDIVQYLVDDWAHHSVIITEVVRDENGNVVDFLMNSNTTDRIDFPVTAYGYTDIRLIKIIGYN